MRLKVKMDRWEDTVVYQVLEQEGISPISSGNCLVFEARSGFKIFSSLHPAVAVDGQQKIYVRGSSRDKDFVVTTRKFPNAEMAEDYLTKALSAFAELEKDSARRRPTKREELPNVYFFDSERSH